MIALLSLLFPLLPAPSFSQQNKPPAEKESVPEAKVRLLQELDRQIDERRKELAREEESLSSLKRALDAAKQELLKEKEKLEELRGQVEADLGKRSKAGEDRLDQVAKVYAAMKPKEAASALEKMDEDMAVGILSKLPNRTVGKIFDLMNKDTVRKFTARMQQGRGGTAER
jgi:flagellar motility protein MotE (MotC chaperone)